MHTLFGAACVAILWQTLYISIWVTEPFEFSIETQIEAFLGKHKFLERKHSFDCLELIAGNSLEDAYFDVSVL